MTFLKKYWPLAIASLALAAALYAWYRPQPAPQKEYVTVEVPKDVIKIKRVEVPVEKVVVIEKIKLVEKRELPSWVKDNETIQVTAVGVVEPWTGQTEVASVINIQTGESSLVSKRLQPPFFAFQNEKELGLRYGTEFDIYGRWTFLRVGSFHLAGYVQAGQNSMAQVEASYRW